MGERENFAELNLLIFWRRPTGTRTRKPSAGGGYLHTKKKVMERALVDVWFIVISNPPYQMPNETLVVILIAVACYLVAFLTSYAGLSPLDTSATAGGRNPTMAIDM